MANKKSEDNIKHPTNPANLSQNQDQRHNVPRGLDKRGGLNPK